VVSDLPAASGLASSSALLTGFTLALLQANGIRAGFEELMEVLPDGEHFVGTRGGGMDHAAVLASRPGCALLVSFAPLSVEPVPIPAGWKFLIAHSLGVAEKSGAALAEYNSRRSVGALALQRLGFPSYRAAIGHGPWEGLKVLASLRLEGWEQRSFLHVAGEALRVRQAVAALRAADGVAFGRLLDASHESLRNELGVSTTSLDTLVAVAREAGALGARLTGAGFGGCAVILCNGEDLERVRGELVRQFYSKFSHFEPDSHLIAAEPSAGALYA